AAPADPTITLVGQLIPAVNTGPDAGVGANLMLAPFRALYPIEYHLYDAQNDQVKVVFDNPALAAVAWQQWLDAKSPDARNQVVAAAAQQITQTPDVSSLSWELMPHYLLYNTLWQMWAGKWLSISGRFSTDIVLHVDNFQSAAQISASFVAQVPNLPPFSTSTTLRRSQQVIVTGYVKITEYNPPPGPTHPGYLGAEVYTLTDAQGQTVRLFIYFSQPNNNTYIIPTSDFLDLGGHCTQFVGWKFDPPRYSDKPDLIEVQAAQETSPPCTTIIIATATPAASGGAHQ
ncbi:MAG: hypothetical protein ACYDBJ_19920, partial [Aggregatilineales bacterium]